MSPAPTPLRALASDVDAAAADEGVALEGDHLNASRFLAEHGHNVRWSPELGVWFLWNGSWWEQDRLERVSQLASQTVDGLRAWVGEAGGESEFKRRSKHYQSSTGSSRRDGLLKLARTDPTVVVAVEDLDAWPMLLACRNGTVDLATGQSTPPERDQLLTRGVDTDYDPGAHSDEWKAFLRTIFGDDRDLTAFVQRLLGYCVTGSTVEHLLPILWGTGANGKSTLIGVLQDLLGDMATTAPEGLLTAHHDDPHPERLAALRGRRLVVSHELEERAVLAEQTVKVLTGGDVVSARQLYGHRFDFMPSHKIVVATNHTPKVRGTDHAIWRRLRLVPFNVTIPPERQDPHLRARLVDDHGPAILAWLVSGAVMWHTNGGVGDAPAVTAATSSYRSQQDVVATFLSERTMPVDRTRTKVGVIWSEWRTWCDESGERPGRQQDFTMALEEHGVDIETYQGQKYARAIGVKADG